MTSPAPSDRPLVVGLGLMWNWEHHYEAPPWLTFQEGSHGSLSDHSAVTVSLCMVTKLLGGSLPSVLALQSVQQRCAFAGV